MNNSNNSVNNQTATAPVSTDALPLNAGMASADPGGGMAGVGVLPGGSSRRTSRVWRYFGMVDNCHYICRLCSFVGAYTNTTNMRKHIQHHHPERFQDILDHTRPTSRPYFAGNLPRLRQPIPYQHATPHYSPALLYPPPPMPKRMVVSKPADTLFGDARSDSDLNLSASPNDSVTPTHAPDITSQSSLHESVSNTYSSMVPQTSAPAHDPSLSMCEMSPEETKFVKQLLPALVETTDSSTDTDIPTRGVQPSDDRSGSEFSHHNSNDAPPIPVSPDHFLSEGNDQDEPTPVPPVSNQQQKPESYQLRHNNHLMIVLEALARDEAFMDVTLTAQGRSLKAHKSVLSAVSSYFRGVLRDNPCQHPIIIMPRDVRFEELYSIVNYIYKGEMTVAAEDLTSLLKTAEILQVSGLASSDSSATVNPQTDPLPMVNVRSSSNSSSASSPTIIPTTVSRPITKTHKSQIQDTPSSSQPKSVERIINPADFMDVDMTCVKEEVVSDGEEDKDGPSNKKQVSHMQETPQQITSCSQPSECSQMTGSEAKDDDDPPNQVILGFPSPDDQTFEQPIPSTSSHETEYRSLGVKSDPENGFNSQTGKGGSSPQPLQCPHCDEQYRNIETIDAHLSNKHPTKPSFICKCGRIFTRQIHHQAHSRMCSHSS